MHPLQAAITALLIFSALIIILTAYQASTEVIPDIGLFEEKIYINNKEITLAEEAVDLVRKKIKGIYKLLLALPLRHAKEYLSYGAYGPAVYEASRAYRILKKLVRTTSRSDLT